MCGDIAGHTRGNITAIRKKFLTQFSYNINIQHINRALFNRKGRLSMDCESLCCLKILWVCVII